VGSGTSATIRSRSPSRSPPDAFHDAFSSSLTTTVFSQRSMRRFGASLRRATPKGQDPSSPAQHRIKDPSYIGPSLRSGHTLAPHTAGHDLRRRNWPRAYPRKKAITIAPIQCAALNLRDLRLVCPMALTGSAEDSESRALEAVRLSAGGRIHSSSKAASIPPPIPRATAEMTIQSCIKATDAGSVN
jgi:hypothetical protein